MPIFTVDGIVWTLYPGNARINGDQSTQVIGTGGIETSLIVCNRSIPIINCVASTGTVKLLFLGDSITYYGAMPKKVKDLLENAGATVSIIGTVPTWDYPEIKCLAVGGWSWIYHHTLNSSPVVYSGVYDPAQYLFDNELDIPDIIFIHLGRNDIYKGFKPTDSITHAIGIIDAWLDIGVKRIGVAILIPPSGMDSSYPNGESERLRDQILHHEMGMQSIWRIHQRDPRVDMVPINLTLHRGFAEGSLPQHFSTIEAHHPSNEGLAAMGEQAYAWINYAMIEEGL